MSCEDILSSLEIAVKEAGYSLDTVQFAPASYRMEIACKVVPDIMKSTSQFSCGNKVASTLGLNVLFHEDNSLTWRDPITGIEKRCGNMTSSNNLLRRAGQTPLFNRDILNMDIPERGMLPRLDIQKQTEDAGSLKWAWIGLGAVAVLGTVYYVTKD